MNANRVMRALALIVAALLLGALLGGCGEATPTGLDQPVVTEEPTSTPLDSPPLDAPLPEPSGDSTTFESPPTLPSATTLVRTTTPLTPIPTGTPDPDRTPVAIVMAEIEPDREIVTIKNVSKMEQDISGWSLFNLASEPVYQFPEGLVLQPGESVQVYSAVSEGEVPQGAFFWTEEKIWQELPADVLLLNLGSRLVFWYSLPAER